MHRLFKSDFFHFEATRLLSFTPYEGGEIAEFLECVGKIKDLDLESWYSVFMEAGTKCEALAEQAESSGNRNAARRCYFRASNYQRAAQFMLNGRNPSKDSRILRGLELSNSNFGRAQQLMDAKVLNVDIPYENINLPGYLYLPHPSTRRPGKLPIFIQTVGGDATQEEIYFIFPREALELGYAVLSFEGPGQGIVLRRDGIPMRPDWETVVTPVIDWVYDYAANHPEANLDLDRLALAGSSVGGYLALRGASDPRVKACISVDPFYCMWDLLKGRIPDFLIHAFEAGGFGSEMMWDYLMRGMCWSDVQTNWEFNHLRWMFGRNSTTEVFQRMRDFTFAQRDRTNFLDKVKCPVFVTGAAYSIYAMPEISTSVIYDKLEHLGNKRTQWIAKEAADGGLQSKVGAFGVLTQKTFAWLDQQFGIDRKIPSSRRS